MKRNVFLLVTALFIASLNLRPAINSVAPLLGTMSADLGMTAATASLLTSIPVLCMGVFSPLAAKASGKWGMERVVGISLLVIGVGTVLRLFTHSVDVLLLTALVAGAGIAFIGPLLPGFIKLHFPNHVPPLIAVYTVALTLGAAVSTWLSIPLQHGFHSWQGSLAFWAVIAFVAAAVWWLFVQVLMKNPASAHPAGVSVKLPWGSGRAWLITLSFGLMGFLFYSLTAWLPQIIEGMGYSKSYSANALTLFVAIQIPVSLVLPLVLRRYPSRRLWLVVESLLELAGLLLLVSHVDPYLACATIGIGAGGLFPLNLLLPIDVTNHHHEAAAWSAKAQSVGYVMSALGPVVLGWIYDGTHSFASAMFAMIAIIVVMVVVQIAATAKRAVPSREHEHPVSTPS
ncbi:MFS transporter [Alicyclobacillus sp. ALC3]|uniref:MFS transporter n=1 Tax=Alicyclobacillus sp. ALC3 TaxID=2796143 RepID=UPI002378C876|nr:MFS transporter [Alicyclobacillus sp. ALC3]WDL95974.1 MFS transporter [Alicyclobacillus sp. ALC3]